MVEAHLPKCLVAIVDGYHHEDQAWWKSRFNAIIGRIGVEGIDYGIHLFDPLYQYYPGHIYADVFVRVNTWMEPPLKQKIRDRRFKRITERERKYGSVRAAIL